MAIRIIWLKSGYAESSKVAWLIYGFPCSQYNKKEAMFSLAEQLYNKYVEDSTPFQRYCCKVASDMAEHCSGCGRRLEKFRFDFEDFQNWLRGLFGSDCNSYGDPEGDWWLFHDPKHILEVPMSQHLVLSDNGDIAILYALHLNPRIDWCSNFDIDGRGSYWEKEDLERYWKILIETGEWSLG